MGIVFFCQSCGARFEVDPRMAGKKGHCRKCGQVMEIPKAEQLASMASLPALAAAAPAPAAAAPQPQAQSLGGWLRAAASSVGLAAISVDRVPIGLRRGTAPSPLDDAEDSKPYLVAGTELGPAPRRAVSRGAGAAMRAWRREVGLVQKLFRWLNESAYFVSIPFVMIFLGGIVFKSRSTAMFAATFVVLLNIGRIVSGIANLAVIPLRDGLNTKRMKKPLRRIIEPVVTIGVVILAFTFIPFLSSGTPATGTAVDRIRSTIGDLKKDMKGEVDKTVDQARTLDVDKLQAQVRKKLEQVGTGEPAAAPAPPAAAPAPKTPSPEAAVRDIIKGVGERVRETVEESQK